MGFLDNAGSIILDAVLSDTGRYRLAKGDGSFKITKFALGDDEINYANYNTNHASGSAYYDLTILQTPCLEAFTNNTSTMNSKLISIARTNLLYLPIIQINDINSTSNNRHSTGAYVVAVDRDTEDSFSNVTGIIMGESLNGGSFIRLDQGLDTTEIPPNFTLDSDLVETQYIIEIDNRFAKLVSTKGTVARMSFIDDDNIASYYLSQGTDPEFVVPNEERTDVNHKQVIQGPRGTMLSFILQSSIELNTSTYLFSLIGGSGTTMIGAGGGSVNVYYIDSYIKVTGATTGYKVDVPVRFIKKV
jgi:hypothetical protein